MPKNNIDSLDKQFSDVITQITSNRSEIPSMPKDRKASLSSQLVMQYTEHRKPIRFARISFGVIAAIIIMGVFFWFISPRPISAAEIISHASLAATDTAAFGLNSYSGIKITWRSDLTPADQQGSLPPNMQERIWAQSPRLLRDESYYYPPEYRAAASLPVTSGIVPSARDLVIAGNLNAVIINDGLTVWWYDVMGKYVTQHNPNTLFLPSFPKGTSAFPADFQSLLSQLGQDPDNITLLGTAIVAGREAYVLSFNPKSDVPTYPLATQAKVWIDKQTYFELGQEFRDKQGLIVKKWIYAEFNPNVPIPPKLFHFTPPADVLVIDTRVSKDEAVLKNAWWSVALSADYEVFRPINLPPTVITELPYYGTLGGYSDGMTQLEQDFYIDGGMLPAVVLLEDKSAGPLTFGLGTPVKIGQYNGEYYEEDGRRVIQIIRDNTWIFLEADQQLMTQEDLLWVARTLELVPRTKP